MHAETLRSFFEGQISSSALAEDLRGAWEPLRRSGKRFIWNDLSTEFPVTPDHLVRVCDAAISGALSADDVQVIGSCLVASLNWTWPEGEVGERLVTIAHAWDTPEINYELTPRSMGKFRHWLLTGEKTLTREDLWQSGGSPA